MLSFFKIRKGGADESSMLAILNDSVIGKMLLWVIMVGTGCYIVWRIFEAINDPYKYGREFPGLLKRTGIALSTLVDMLIVYAAIKVLIGIGDIRQSGEPYEQRELVRQLLATQGGAAALATIGIVVMTAAIVQLVYGVRRGYQERMTMDRFSRVGRIIVHILAWGGYCSRGIIVGITGFFLIKAAFSGVSDYVVNTDKAFDFIGDEIGHGYFILVAVGTVCYGVFMIILGVTYNQDGR